MVALQYDGELYNLYPGMPVAVEKFERRNGADLCLWETEASARSDMVSIQKWMGTHHPDENAHNLDILNEVQFCTLSDRDLREMESRYGEIHFIVR